MQMEVRNIFEIRPLGSTPDSLRLMAHIARSSFSDPVDRKEYRDALVGELNGRVKHSADHPWAAGLLDDVINEIIGVVSYQLAANTQNHMAAFFTFLKPSIGNPGGIFIQVAAAKALNREPVTENAFYNLMDDLAFEASDSHAPVYNPYTYYEVETSSRGGGNHLFVHNASNNATDVVIDDVPVLLTMIQCVTNQTAHSFYVSMTDTLAGLLPTLGDGTPFKVVKGSVVSVNVTGETAALEPEECQLTFCDAHRGYAIGPSTVAWSQPDRSGSGEVIDRFPYRWLLGGERSALLHVLNRLVGITYLNPIDARKAVTLIMAVMRHKDGFFTANDMSSGTASSNIVMRMRFIQALVGQTERPFADLNDLGLVDRVFNEALASANMIEEITL